MKLVRQLHSSARSCSHIGSAPITIPTNVKLELPVASISPSLPPSSPLARRIVRVKGPLGYLQVSVPPPIIFNENSSTVNVSVHDQAAKSQRSLWGLTRTLIQNAVTGVSDGYSLELRLVGVGYRAAVEPIPPVFLELQQGSSTERLNMKLGYAHPVLVDIPSDISVSTPAPTRIVLKGTDKQTLGLFAAKIRRWRKPEPYRGKGIFIGDETIKLKEVKKK